jgi:signal transduction histidine kinase
MQMSLAQFYERVHPDDLPQLKKHRRERYRKEANGEIPAAVEYRFMHRNGGYRWMAECPAVLRDDDGNAETEIGTIRDITESKTAEQAIRNALRMEATATLAGGIAHDFNNLMVGVLGNAELLQMRLGAQDLDVARMLNVIAGSAQKAGELAQQMLAFAHGGKYQPSIINLNTTVEETLWLEKRKIPDRVLVESRLDSTLRNTLADAAQMSQVVLNLLMNAVEAIDGEGRVTVNTRNEHVDGAVAETRSIQPGDYVRLDVTDTGHGMSAETQSHVFEPFFTTKFQGRGLGLAAVFGIVTNHGGCIAVNSTPGSGSTFTVYLPAVEEKSARGTKSSSSSLPRGSETVMLVDDEAVVLEVTRSILERLGYKVICALNGQEAVELAKSYDGDIHLVLLDMAMPVMGGAQAYPLIREQRPKIKAIIYSGYELDPAAQAVLDAGANDYIQKPFRTRMLASKVRQILDA